MEHRNKRAEGKGELKAQRHVNEDADQAEGECEERATGQFLADAWAHGVGLFDGQSGIGKILLKFGHDGIRRAETALHGDEFAALFCRSLQGGFTQVGGFDAAAQVVERDVFVGAEHDKVATREVDPEVFLSAPGEESDRPENEDKRQGECDVTLAEKVDAMGRNPVEHAQLFQAEIVQHEPEDRAGEK